MSQHEQESWVSELTEMLRALPGGWDDRRGQEFDSLSSKERGVIQAGRSDALSIVGRLLLRAILDHGWRPNNLFLLLEDKAHWARQSERTKPYEQGAIKFLGMFIDWCRSHARQLPPAMPPFVRIKSHHTGFRTEDISRDDFVKTCEAIAWLVGATAPLASTKMAGDIEGARGGSKREQKRPGWERLTIVRSNTGDDLAQLDGKEHRLTGASDATFLEQLQAKRGEPMLGTTLNTKCGERPSRVYSRLPKPIQRIIDKPGHRTGKKGYRML